MKHHPPPPPPPVMGQEISSSQKHNRAGIFKESVGARNRGGIGLSYRPARPTLAGGIHSLESIPGLHKRLKIRAQYPPSQDRKNHILYIHTTNENQRQVKDRSSFLFEYSFCRARVCWPLLCLCRPFYDFVRDDWIRTQSAAVAVMRCCFMQATLNSCVQYTLSHMHSNSPTLKSFHPLESGCWHTHTHSQILIKWKAS